MVFTKKPHKTLKAASSRLMAQSLSSLLSNSTHSFPFPNPNPNLKPNLIHRYTLPHSNRTLSFTRNSTQNNQNRNLTSTPPPRDDKSSNPEKKSFAVSTGELFLGIAARFLKTSNRGFSDNPESIPVMERTKTMTGRDIEERIGKVMVDDTKSEVIWEQRIKDVEAEKERRVITSPGFSFSAAGLLFPYHLGVAQFLIEKGYIKETTPLAGSSAGAIVCAVVASGASMQEALKATKILAEDCRLKGTAFRLGAVLRNVLQNFLPDDAHTRSNGRVRVAVTQIFWRPRGLLVDQFDSKEDLINAVVASSFIPGYLAPRPATMFRNRLCIDGGLTLFMPPTSATKTVCVCAFPASGLGLEGIGISPDCNPESRASPRELFNWALEPAEDHVLDRLFELGYLDAAVWAEENPVEKIVEDGSPLVENGSAN
ncbi:hypothetical protein EZV62_019078 [Acer yangbiense]|uniref:Patatin n=1 Tax=Acer yangbiense TaxID=1000413 RepID=A0A5C7HBA4_9ROSI|nr:hypothetical protein EZV62_019078 [Acer yangbiense]